VEVGDGLTSNMVVGCAVVVVFVWKRDEEGGDGFGNVFCLNLNWNGSKYSSWGSQFRGF